MLKLYALLIQRYIFDLQSGMWEGSTEYLIAYDTKQAEYTRKMDRLYKRLQREHNFDKQRFYALQDQSITF